MRWTTLPHKAARAGFALAFAAATVPQPALAQVWEVDSYFYAGVSQEGGRHSEGLAVGDFDGDGLDDLYVGAPGFDGTETAVDGGIVCRSRSLPDRTIGSFPGGSAGCTYSTVAGGEGGTALVAGDFDGDGRDEVAYSTPRGELFGVEESGYVQVTDYDPITQTWSGFVFTQSAAAPADDQEEGDRFGEVLAVGNFDGDAYEDLVVGSPMEDLGSEKNVGVVQVFYGSASGLDPGTNLHQTFFSGEGALAGSRTPGEHTGAALAAGDFNGDGYDDLVFSAPDRPVSGRDGAGEVHVLYGSVSGLLTTGQELFSDVSFGLTTTEENKQFGAALAAGDFDGDAFSCAFGSCADELAIGVPGATVSGLADAGKVRVLPGSTSGLGTTGVVTLSGLDTAVGPQAGARFGAGLAAGFTDPGYPEDLVVGSPQRDVHSGLVDDGYVNLFFGDAGGLDAGRGPQEIPMPPSFNLLTPESGDSWGEVLRLGDLDGDGWGDLVIGIPSKDWTSTSDIGGFHVRFGALFADGFEAGTTAGWTATMP